MSKVDKTSDFTSNVSLRRSRRRPAAGQLADAKSDTTTIDVLSQQDKSDTSHPKKIFQYENTYKTEPDEIFKVGSVERLTHEVLEERLKDVQYDAKDCKQLSQDLAAVIMDKIKALQIKRYKIVAVVSIGSLREKPGMQFGSRCLWNQKTDSFASIKYTNGSLFAVAMVYGLYYE